MSDTDFHDVPLSGQQFASQLLRSHLQIAGIGLLVVLIALTSTIYMHAKINTVLKEWEPTDRASSRILSEVQSSLAALRGWVNLGDEDSLQEWKRSWSQGIRPLLEELRYRLNRLDDSRGQEILDRLRPMLRKLYISQWRIRDVALALGNEPARTIFLREVEPVANDLGRLLETLIEEQHNQITSHRDQVTLLRVKGFCIESNTMLKKFMDQGLPNDERLLRESLQKAWSTFDAWAEKYARHTHGQHDYVSTIQKEFLAIKILSDEVVKLRKSDQWNLAQSLMRTEAIPLSNEVVTNISSLLSHVQSEMDQRSLEATLISTVTIILLILLVISMIVAAFLLSKRRAVTLTQPIWRLVQGVKTFSEGKLDQDIPVTTNNELGELTRSFNRMRSSLQKSYGEIEKANFFLRENQRSLAMAQAIAHLGNWDWDIIADTLHWSDEIYRIFGVQPQQFAASYQLFLNAVHPDDQKKVVEAIKVSLEDPLISYRVEHRVVRPDGSECIVEERGEIIRDEVGKPLRMLGTVLDITERKVNEIHLSRIHEKLKNQEAHLRAILENALDAIITIEKDGFVKEFNPAAERLFGYPAKEAIGRDVATLIIPPELRAAHTKALASHAIQADGRRSPAVKRRVESPGMRSDGKIIDLDIGLTAIHQDGQLNYIGFLRDITDRKQLLISLRDTLEVAESVNRAKSEFLANMSHEIRSPMNAIMGMTELVLSTNLTENQRENLEIVQNSSNDLLGLINDILDVSKIEAGQLKLESLPFDLRGRMENSCESMAFQTHQKGLELYCDIAPDVLTLMGDSLRLNQILINLLNNAIKFTSEGEVVLRVEKSPGQKESKENIVLHFSVSDTGIGIPNDRISSIFKRFTQVDGSTTRKYGGTGLGLTISKRLVEMMNGEIWVESKEGEGSTFHFTARFGVDQRVIFPLNKGLEERKRHFGPSHLTGVKVLIGDSHSTGRNIIKKMLSFFGAEVEEAATMLSFQKSLQLTEQQSRPFDAILFDYGLSRQSENRAEWGRKVMVMIPTHIRAEDLVSQQQFQNAFPLKKPVKLYALLKGMDRLLGRTAAEDDKKTALSRQNRSYAVPLHILLVDDLVNNQKLASNILEQAGHSVVLANNGREGLERLASAPFDLVLMDLHMPEMDGYGATQYIREGKEIGICDPQIPIVAVTAHVVQAEKKKCLAAGMNGYLRKPYRADELLDAIEPFTKKIKPNRKTEPRSDTSPILIQVNINAEMLQSLQQTFLKEGPKHVLLASQALQNRDVNLALKEVQWIKIVSADIGAKQVKVQTIHLKGMIELKKWDEAQEVFNVLEQMFQKTIEALSSR